MSGWNRYGHYRYGYAEYYPEKRSRRRLQIDRGPTAEELFGAGVALRTADDEEGEPWDFAADATGDLAATVGQDELRKDLAFQTARDATGMVGTLPSPNQNARLANDIEVIGQRDSRVNSVEAAVEASRTRPNQIDAQVEVDAETERLPRMVFPIGTGP